MSSFSTNLKVLMSQKGLNGKQLANQLGVSPSTVSMWLTGRSKPNIDTLDKIAEVLQVSTESLITTRTQYAMKRLALNLRRLREEANVTSRTVGYVLGIGGRYGILESGECDTVNPDHIEQIAEYFEVTPASLFDWDNDSYNLNQDSSYTKEELKEIQDFADFIKSRRKTETPGADRPPAEPPETEGQPPAGADPREDNNQDNE